MKEYEDAAMSGTTSDRPQYQLMLSEVGTIRPAAVILWKTDRLGCDRFELADAKRRIRDAGCRICLIAEPTPDDSPESVLMETMMEGVAEFYSRQLSVNIRRGMAYNAEHALYNGHKVWGYGVDGDKHYVVDDAVAPFVVAMFTRYADGEAMLSICDDFNAKGLRTTRGALFGVKTVDKLLKNRAYIGEYRHGGVTVEGGIPQIVDEELFDRAQRRLAENKRNGSRRKASVQAQDAPRYWLTDKLYCGECGGSMQGVSGTSKTGAKHYYYYCKEQRAKRCAKRPVRKEWIEDAVTGVLKGLLDDSENLASIAVDEAKYYEDNYKSIEYLSSLEQQRRDVEKGLANFVNAIEVGIFNETTQRPMAELQERKDTLNDAIETETVSQPLFEDEHSIRAYFDRFLHADFDNPEVRDSVLEYFVDKIYLHEDRLVVTSWYSEDNREVPMEVLNGEAEDLFAEGEAVKFDCFPFGSTHLKPRVSVGSPGFVCVSGVPLWREVSLGAREPLAQLRQFFVEEPRRFFVDRCEPLNPGDRDRAVFDERRDCAVNVGAVALEHHTQVFSFLECVALLEIFDGVFNKRRHCVVVHASTLAGVLLCRLVAHARLARSI